MIVVGRNVSVRQENAKVLFLMDAEGKCLANIAATRYLVMLGLCPCEISVNLWLKLFLTLFLAVSRGQVVKFVIRVQNVGDHVVGFLRHRAFCNGQPEGLDLVCKVPTCINPAPRNV